MSDEIHDDFPKRCTFPRCPCSDERICFAEKPTIDGLRGTTEEDRTAITTEKRIELIGEHAQELGRVDVLHEQQLDEIARILQIARRRARST